MCCKGKRDRDDAVSELVGEMLMLTIVLILLAIFSATASNYLPPPRDPSVTIIAKNVPSTPGSMNICLYHKGGDWIKTSDLTVIVSHSTDVWKYAHDNASVQLWPDPGSQSFDLGDWITITNVPKATYEVSLVTPRAVVFSGMVVPES